MNQTAWIPPAMTEREEARLKELHGLHILDTAAELRFDRLTSLVAELFEFPVVLVSLVDRDRQWFKSRLGWDVSEVPRDISFCGHTINNERSVMVVPDALEDPRFAGNPLVTGHPWIRFYAGVVVHGPTGQPLGTLCVLDHQPRHFDEYQCSLLRQFADLVENEITHSADLATLRHSVEFSDYYDPLTQLPNRRLLLDRLEQLVELATTQSLRAAVWLFNIRGLRVINQSLGSECGDALLRQLAERLRDNCPGGGSVARLQADEFVMIFPVLNDNELEAAGQRLRSAVEQPYRHRGREHHLRVQIGGSLFPDQGGTAAVLIEQASAAIRHSQPGGPEPVRYFSQAHSENLTERLAIESRLGGALARGEFHLLYQPIVSLTNGTMIGMEALLRWRCPELGLVPPERFIALAEESGLILSIGRWVRREACRQLQQWCCDPEWDIPLAVNVSPAELMHPDFARNLIDELERGELSCTLLWIEITEFSLLGDNEVVNRNLSLLQEHQVRINIDDFGTGYSSLSYLRRLPVNTLKIDRVFVSGLPDGENESVLACTIIDMARALRLGQVAEGIENVSQLQFLRDHHCQGGQGYLFSRPVPAERIPALRGRALVH